MDRGFGLDHRVLRRHAGGPVSWNDPPRRLSAREAHVAAVRQGVCQCPNHMKLELSLAALALAEAAYAAPPDAKGGKPAKKDAKKKEEQDKVLDELINQAIKLIVMHEVGHTLGLRHNFKGSTMLTHDQLHDTKITREKGLVGSVMDYSPVNIAPRGVKQGDFFSTTLGPYDYWAIEYAYKPLSGGTEGEAAELKKIAARGASEFGLDYGTDEDTFLTADPLTNRFDLGKDVMRFAQERMTTTEELLKSLATRVVEEGEGYQRARVALRMLLAQYGNGAYLMSKYVGGEHAHRDHRNDPKGRDPLVPVTADKQREALKFLRGHVFSDRPFQFPPDLLRKLAVNRWMHWGADYSSTDFPLYERILGIQRLAMNQMLSPSTLHRIQANALKAEKGAKPLTVAEVFRAVTDSVWSDVANDAAKKELGSSIIRRNLQREHLKKLTLLVLGEKSGGRPSWADVVLFGGGGSSVPPDARSLARLHLKQIANRIDEALKAPGQADETRTAHLDECKERITKVLSASMQAND
jgi:hypothetical protein